MAGSFPGILLRKGIYYARVVVPKDVRHLLGSELWVSLKTANIHDARKVGPTYIADFKLRIALARRGEFVPGSGQRDPTRDARIALAQWALAETNRRVDASGATETPWQVRARVDALSRAWQEVDGWKEIEDFDATLAGALRTGGLAVSHDNPIIPMMRQEGALTMMYALLNRERDRQTNVLRSRADAVSGTDLDNIIAADPEEPLPRPSLSIRQLFDRWVVTVTRSEKEIGRLHHQIRRLIEAVGDKPANYLTRSEVEEFMGLVGRFPGRKRPAALNTLPIRELIEKFETENAKRDGPWRTLTKTTAGEWFASFNRMFRYAVVMGLIESNPFDRLNFTVKGAEGVVRREYTDAEIHKIFGSPLFQGFSTGDGSQRFRNKPGTKVIKDAKYWLPILSLFHGARLTELAAMRLEDFKATDNGVHYFDLTERQVKTATSKRLVPLHPHMIELGFLDHVEGLRSQGADWLFPDLDHVSKLGPGHEFSKFWGDWCDEHGLTDPSITYHSWRHTWKRRARSSPVKEEMHDIISGHKPMNVGRGYGAGADIEPLARDMALITFPAFPALPS